MTSSRRAKRIRTAVAIVLTAGLAWALVSALAPPPNVAARAQAAQTMVEHVRATRTVQANPGPSLTALPLPQVEDAAQRKTLFIAAMLPFIVRENARIEKQRARAATAPKGGPHYAALAYVYGLQPNVARATLLERIDIVPTSLVLAQGALESAWGTSRFARQGNAYFGERTYNLDVAGLTPGAAPTGQGLFKVKSFFHAHLSVRSFLKTLNTHPAYRDLRRHRAALRASGKRPTGLALAPLLHNYSEIGEVYVQRVIATMRGNRLGAFDGLTLVDQ